jgi:hypothetical protein
MAFRNAEKLCGGPTRQANRVDAAPAPANRNHCTQQEGLHHPLDARTYQTVWHNTMTVQYSSCLPLGERLVLLDLGTRTLSGERPLPVRSPRTAARRCVSEGPLPWGPAGLLLTPGGCTGLGAAAPPPAL